MTITAILAGVAAVLAAIIGAFVKGQRMGRNTVKIEEVKANEAARKEYRKIDSAPVDFERSVGRLRDRARQDRGGE